MVPKPLKSLSVEDVLPGASDPFRPRCVVAGALVRGVLGGQAIDRVAEDRYVARAPTNGALWS